jgi:segregation and condensation protein A
MAYLDKATALDMELGSEFVYMAATLIHIKSRTLLPRDPELERMEAESDPRQELVDRLLEHEQYKNAAEMLQQKRMLEEAAWSNPQIRQFLTEDEVINPGLDVSLFDLVKTFQAVLERAKNRPSYDIVKEDVTVPDMIRYLRNMLINAGKDKQISATALFEEQHSRRAMLCLFLAILELVKRQAVKLHQTALFDDILISAAEGFDSATTGDEAIAAVEEEYK